MVCGTLSDGASREVKSRLLKLGLVCLVGLGIFLAHRYEFLQKILEGIKSLGPAAPGVFAAVYALACVLFVPSFVFSFSGGVLFGFWQGGFLSLIGNTLGSLSAFLIGRYLVREWVEEKFTHNPEFQKLSRAIKKKGWKVILLARFSPIFPFLIGNYAFGATRVHLRHYGIATFIGSMPSVFVCSYLGFLTGDAARAVSSSHARTPQEWALLGFGLAATLFLAWYLRRIAEQEQNT